jgi:hypothetical protein
MSDQSSSESVQAKGEMPREKYEALVLKVADKVWHMLQAELRLANERRSKRDRRA